jgi:hypothetical protein
MPMFFLNAESDGLVIIVEEFFLVVGAPFEALLIAVTWPVRYGIQLQGWRG